MTTLIAKSTPPWGRSKTPSLQICEGQISTPPPRDGEHRRTRYKLKIHFLNQNLPLHATLGKHARERSKLHPPAMSWRAGCVYGGVMAVTGQRQAASRYVAADAHPLTRCAASHRPLADMQRGAVNGCSACSHRGGRHQQRSLPVREPEVCVMTGRHVVVVIRVRVQFCVSLRRRACPDHGAVRAAVLIRIHLFDV